MFDMQNGILGPASKASDVWAFGMLLYETLSNRLPFEGLSNQHIISVLSKAAAAQAGGDAIRASLPLPIGVPGMER
jgi:serine/threonine protein kinase